MTSLLLIGQVTPTLIITQSKPKVFQLTNSKIAIVFDENDEVARDHVQKIQENQRYTEQEQAQQQQNVANPPQAVQADTQSWPQVQEPSSSGNNYHQAVMGETKMVQQHTQMFHHQVDATHDDG